MAKQIWLHLFSHFFATLSFCQQYDAPFGVVHPAEFSNHSAEGEPEAIVLNEFGETYFGEGDGRLYLIVHKKIKLLRKEGLEQANIVLYLGKGKSGREELVSVEGVTHVLDNGSVISVPMGRKSVFRQNNLDFEKISFTLPNANVGSIIEFRYTLSTPFILNLWPWEFQSSIPKVNSEFWAKIPGNYVYNASLRGALKLTKNDSELIRSCFGSGSAMADCSLLKFGMTNIPAFKEEEFMTAKRNFLSAIRFELSEIKYFDGRVDKVTKEWKDVADEMYENELFGSQVKKARNMLDSKVKEQTLGLGNPLNKAKRIYAWIRDSYQWNENLGKYTDLGVKSAWELKKGNVADINLSLLGALQSAGLDALPVILSTRANGLPGSLYPVLSEFNYVIVHLKTDHGIFLLDATDPFLPFGMIPERCLNGKGRLLSKRSAEEIDIVLKEKTRIIFSYDLKLDEHGKISGHAEVMSYGYAGADKRRTISSYTSESAYAKMLTEKWMLNEVHEYKVENLTDFDKPLKEEIELSFHDHDASDATRVYFNPFVTSRWSKNPFNLPSRSFPVDFGIAQEETTVVNLEFHPSFKLDEIMKSTATATPDKSAIFRLNATALGNKISIVYSVSLNRAVYDATEYLALKGLFEQIVQTKQNDLVFVKK